MSIPPSGPPAEIAELARRREEARAKRDFATADSLKTQIEAEGWRVVDRGARSSVTPAAPASSAVDGETRYGSASAVPSRLDAPADAPWSVVLLASEDAARTSRLMAALRLHAPADTQVVIVANDPSDQQAAALAPGGPDRVPIRELEPEILRTSTRLGYAAALNIALRRVSGELVLMADGRSRPSGDAFSALAQTLADPGVSVAGAFGLASTEPGRLRPASLESTSTADPHALLAPWLAFRRADLIDFGPLDEHFVVPAWLDVWWSLRLRAGLDPSPAVEAEDWDDADVDPGEADPNEADPNEEETAEPAAADSPDFDRPDLPPPRRAVRLDLPLESEDIAWPPDRSRLARRNMYRVLNAFGWRSDLFESE